VGAGRKYSSTLLQQTSVLLGGLFKEKKSLHEERRFRYLGERESLKQIWIGWLGNEKIQCRTRLTVPEPPKIPAINRNLKSWLFPDGEEEPAVWPAGDCLSEARHVKATPLPKEFHILKRVPRMKVRNQQKVPLGGGGGGDGCVK